MRRAAASVCAIALVAVVSTGSGVARTTSGSKHAISSREAALIAAVNAARRIHLLPRLQVDGRLEQAARAHSRDMLRRQYFAHGDFGSRMLAFHVRGRLFAENLVWGSGIMSAGDAVAEWLASPPHRENLLDPKLRRIGVATPVGDFEGFSPATVVTADFAGG